MQIVNRLMQKKDKNKKKMFKSSQSRIFTRFSRIKNGIKFLIIVKIVVFTRIRYRGLVKTAEVPGFSLFLLRRLIYTLAQKPTILHNRSNYRKIPNKTQNPKHLYLFKQPIFLSYPQHLKHLKFH